MQKLDVTMDYQPAEYLRIVGEVVQRKKAEMLAAGKDSWLWHLPAWLDKAIICAVALPAFYYKTRKLGHCRFEIDAAGIRRRSKLGEKDIAWDKLVAVRKLPEAYLLEVKQGAMPLMFRCMSAPERAALERWVGERGLWARSDAGFAS